MKFQITVICSETRSITPEQAKEEFNLEDLPTKDEIVALLEDEIESNMEEFCSSNAGSVNIEIIEEK